MKNESVQGKLLQRGNVSRPKKDNLIAEGKLNKETNITEKSDVSIESKQTINDYVGDDSYNLSTNKIMNKPKSIKRLFNSVKRLNGIEPSIVCTNLPQMTSIPEVQEDIDYPCLEIIPLVTPKEDNKKQLPIKQSQKIIGMARNWDNRYSNPEENEIAIDEKELEESTSLKHNPKLLKRLYNTKKRLCGNDI